MKKKNKKKSPPRKARPVDATETKLQVEVAMARASVEDDTPPVCSAFGCYESAPEHGGHCVKHVSSEPHVVSEPSTAEEIAASDNIVIREAVAKVKPAPYVPPPLADPPVLPDLTGHTLEFHAPPGRRGMYCDVGLALLPDAGVVVWRTTDRLAGEVSYALAAAGDLDDVQTGEVTSRAWYPATEEQHVVLAAHDFETDLRAIAKKEGPVAEAFVERLLGAAPVDPERKYT